LSGRGHWREGWYSRSGVAGRRRRAEKIASAGTAALAQARRAV